MYDYIKEIIPLLKFKKAAKTISKLYRLKVSHCNGWY